MANLEVTTSARKVASVLDPTPTSSFHRPLGQSRLKPGGALLLATILGICITGCATQSAADLSPANMPTAFSNSGDSQAAFEGLWWGRFDDPALTALVTRALTANHDVLIATERVRQARAGSIAARSYLWPSLGVGGSIDKQLSGMPVQVKQSGVPDARLSRIDAETSWEIDVFGGNSAAARAASRDTHATEYGEAATRLLVSSEVARQYFILKGAEERLQTVEHLARTQRDTERLTRSREREGVASRFDVDRATSERASVESQIPPLRILVATTKQRISVLLGTSSIDAVPELKVDESAAIAWPVIPVVSPGQPSQLLQRRPDLLAAEQQFVAEGDRLRQAQSNRWPKVFLNAMWGREDYQLNSANFAPARFSAVGLTFQMPIFTAGRVQAGIDAQTSVQRAAWLNYQKLTLNALEDVNDSLVSLNEESIRLGALNDATTAQRSAQAHAESLYREGQIDLLELLDVQRNVLAYELAQTASKTQQALDAVLLYKALGGGWESSTVSSVMTSDASASRQ